MEPRITLFAIIMLLGSAHGLFLALALVNTKGGSKAGQIILAFLTLSFAIDLGHEFLFQTAYLLTLPVLLYLDPLVNLIYGPLIYVYVRTLTEEQDYKVRGVQWLHFLPIGLGLLLCLFLPTLNTDQLIKLFYKDMSASIQEERITVSAIGSIASASVVSIGVYLVLSFVRLRRHAMTIRQQFSSIERITLNWLRNLLIAISVLYLILMFDGFLSHYFGLHESVNRLLYLMVVAVIYTMGYLGYVSPPYLLGQRQKLNQQILTLCPYMKIIQIWKCYPQKKYLTSSLDADMSLELDKELQKFMTSDHPFLDSKITLPQLAKQMGISPNYLSQVINEQEGKNFFDFINHYRVEEAKRLLLASEKKDLNIITVAFEAGFNSKSAFYSAFKKHVGTTPGQFRDSQKTDC